MDLEQIDMDVAAMVPIFTIISENDVQKEVALAGFTDRAFGGGFFHGHVFSFWVYRAFLRGAA